MRTLSETRLLHLRGRASLFSPRNLRPRGTPCVLVRSVRYRASDGAADERPFTPPPHLVAALGFDMHKTRAEGAIETVSFAPSSMKLMEVLRLIPVGHSGELNGLLDWTTHPRSGGCLPAWVRCLHGKSRGSSGVRSEPSKAAGLLQPGLHFMLLRI